MRITLKPFKSTEPKHTVTVNGSQYTFDTLRDAMIFIDALRKEAA